MSPEQRQIKELQKQVTELTNFMRSFENVGQLSPNVIKTIVKAVGTLRLSNLADVSGTDSASSGQVLKKTSGTWQPGTDNTGP